MNNAVNIIILEDNASDEELILRELRKSGLDFHAEIASDKQTLVEVIKEFVPDLMLADYSLPGFTGISAMLLIRERFGDIPVIIVSGAIGEELAIETLKAGATDYVLKDRLGRLGPVVQRALQESEELAKRKRAEEALAESESFYRQTLESIPGMVFTTRANGYCDYQSSQWVKFTGVPAEEMVGDGWNKLLHPDDQLRVFAAWRAAVEERRRMIWNTVSGDMTANTSGLRSRQSPYETVPET